MGAAVFLWPPSSLLLLPPLCSTPFCELKTSVGPAAVVSTNAVGKRVFVTGGTAGVERADGSATTPTASLPRQPDMECSNGYIAEGRVDAGSCGTSRAAAAVLLSLWRIVCASKRPVEKHDETTSIAHTHNGTPLMFKMTHGSVQWVAAKEAQPMRK
jgi:hypothetical protein